MINDSDMRNIRDISLLPPPGSLKTEFAVSAPLKREIIKSRETVRNILLKRDKRLLAIVGPCSIHNPDSAIRYARLLKELSDKVSSKIFIVMRAYFEKPRTTLGWKGLIYDPDLNGEYDIAKGVAVVRNLMLRLADECKLPLATELLDPVTASYISDLVSYASIGARTTESPTHRQFASGLDVPLGFKNGTDGNIQTAIDAINTARAPHSYIGMLENGHCGIFRTRGNPHCHIILRGGSNGINYDEKSVADAVAKLKNSRNVVKGVVIDCSHGNSMKNHIFQSAAFREGLKRHLDATSPVRGLMLESFIKEGRQDIQNDHTPDPDISVSDSCIGFDETQSLIFEAYNELKTISF